MSEVRFYVTLGELEDARQEFYIQGIMQGQRNIEEVRLAENQEWQILTRKLRELAQKHGADQDEIDACWKVNHA